MSVTKHLARLSVAGLTAGLLVAAPSMSADAADAAPVVSIRAELDLPSLGSDGPRVFAVNNVVAGAGIELGPANEISNPSDWTGAIAVDVNPAVSGFTVGPPDDEDFNDYQSVKVTITSSAIGSAAYLGGKLFFGGTRSDYTRTITPVPGGVQVLWTVVDPEESLDVGGTESFIYAAPKDTAAPDTTITAATAAKIKKAKKGKKAKKTAAVTATFTSTEASTFACSIDAGAFVACTSPLTAQLRKGRHTIAVRATDAAGNVDATPATTTVTVKKAKAKKKK